MNEELMLHRRVERLETAVDLIQRQIAQLQAQTGLPPLPVQNAADPARSDAAANAVVLPTFELQPPVVATGDANVVPVVSSGSDQIALTPSPVARPSIPARRRFDLVRDGEYWLNKLGIGLLLFGVAFLFKYSIDQGWLTAEVRVLLGLLLGGGLLGVGAWLRDQRRGLSHVLLGGGIGTFYITIFAAYQLYDLVSHSVAFGGMTAVTTLAYLLAVWRRHPVLSIVATLGGLGTPFVLTTSSANVPGLISYISIVLAGVAALYWYCGWRSLLWTACVGVWPILGLSAIGIGFMGTPDLIEQWSVQLGVGWAWCAFWLLPLARDDRSDPQAMPPIRAIMPTLRRVSTPLLTLTTPPLALGISALLWNLSQTAWGWIVLGVALVFASIAWMLRGRDPLLVDAHLIGATLLLTTGLVLLLRGDVLIVALAAEAAAILFVARRVGERVLPVIAHGLFAIVALWLTMRLSDQIALGLPLLNGRALTDLVILGVIWAASHVVTPLDLQRLYRSYVQLALLGWLWREVSALPHGLDWLLLVWAIYAGLLHWRGARRNDRIAQAIGHLTFGFVALLLSDGLSGSAPGLLPIFNLSAALELVAIGLALLSSWVLSQRQRTLYRLAAYGAVLLWFASEFSRIPDGGGYLSIAWGLYGVALLVLGLRLDRDLLVKLGIGTLLLVVLKLFVVDLAELQAIWRILLFMGFGAAFLVLSYLFPTLWRPRRTADRSDRLVDLTSRRNQNQ